MFILCKRRCRKSYFNQSPALGEDIVIHPVNGGTDKLDDNVEVVPYWLDAFPQNVEPTLSVCETMDNDVDTLCCALVFVLEKFKILYYTLY